MVVLSLLSGCGGGGSTSLAGPAIAFQSTRAVTGSDASIGITNIWRMNQAGSALLPLTKITTANVSSGEPVWSPDGSKIAFSSTRALDGSDAANTNFAVNIWVMNADGSAATPLTRLTVPIAISPRWSPDGTKILFSSFRALDGSDTVNTNTTTNLWIMNADGSNPTPLTRLTAAFAGVLSASWAPNGSKVVFLSARAPNGTDAAGPQNIWFVNVDGSGATPVTKFAAATSQLALGLPPWSPDGTTLAFLSDGALDGSDALNVNAVTNLWLVNADGTNARPLTRFTATAELLFPYAWSPDGKRIAFSSLAALDGSDALNLNSTFNVWLINADGSGRAPLTQLTATGSDTFVDGWSADGTQLILESKRALDGSNAASAKIIDNIFVLDATGTGLKPLTTLINADSFGATVKP
jgi:Tol biopolymer transport system component